MTPQQTIRADLNATRLEWREAVQGENREAETVCMKRMNRLLERLFVFTGQEKVGAR